MTSSPPHLRQDLRETATLALPVILSQLSIIGMHTTDVAMVGRFSTSDLSGMALGNAISATSFMISLGTLSAVNPMVAQAEGAGDKRACGRAFGQGLWLALAMSLVMMALMTQVETLLVMFGQQPAVAKIAQRFVTPLSFGYPALLGFVAMRQFVEGLSQTRPAMIITLFGLILNVLLNLVLIYGYFGLPALGASGSGLGTAIVNWISFTLFVLYVRRTPRFRDYDVGDVRHGPRWSELRHLLAIGIPIGVSFGMEVGAFTFTSIFMGWFGAAPIAAHQIALNICSVTFMVPLGISIAGAVRVGQAKGRGDLEAVRRAGWATYALAAGFMCLTSIMLVTIGGYLFRLYNRDPEVIAVGAGLLLVGAAFQLFDGLQVAGSGALRGLKDTRVPMLANIAAYWVIGVPSGYLFAFTLGWGPSGLWWGLTCGLIFAGLSLLVRFRRMVAP